MDIISTEKNNTDTLNIDLASTEEILNMMNNEDKKVSAAVKKVLPEVTKAVDIIADRIEKGGHVIYFGAGTSGRLGVLDASECPPTFGVSPDLVKGIIAGGDEALRNAIEGAEDNYVRGIIDLNNALSDKNDVVVGISASGNAKWLLGVIKTAKDKNCAIITICCNQDAAIKEFSDVFICPNVGPEVITGSSRLKAGTAQKMILNMLSTASMIKIGKTYQNYMIDLLPTNEKLKQRAKRIVITLTECDEQSAEITLEKANWKVKEAVIMIKKNIEFEAAQELLKMAHGKLREII